MKHPRPLAFAALLSLTLAPVVAAARLNGVASPSVAFTAKGPAGFKILGTTSDLSVRDDGANVVVSVQLENIATGVGLRDKHTRRALDVDKYPMAQLTVARSTLKFPESSGSEADGSGTMVIHGTSRPVAFHYVARREDGMLAISATANINFNDFGVQAPSYAGITVKPDVALRVEFKTSDN